MNRITSVFKRFFSSLAERGRLTKMLCILLHSWVSLRGCKIYNSKHVCFTFGEMSNKIYIYFYYASKNAF